MPSRSSTMPSIRCGALSAKNHALLAGTRYLWLRNPDKLSEYQRAILDELPMRHLKTARAWRIRLAFQDFYQQLSSEAGRPISGGGTSGQLTAACRRSSLPLTPSNDTGMASCAGSTARSPTVSSKASTAWCKPLKPKHGATAPCGILPPWSISSSANSTSNPTRDAVTTHTKQRRTEHLLRRWRTAVPGIRHRRTASPETVTVR
jgi:hypothetical protein